MAPINSLLKQELWPPRLNKIGALCPCCHSLREEILLHTKPHFYGKYSTLSTAPSESGFRPEHMICSTMYFHHILQHLGEE
jgi:hypothetical protein